MTNKVRALGAQAAERLNEIRALVAPHSKISDVVRWLSELGRPGGLSDVITQDEFTHDITVPLERGIYLVYDVT